MKQKYINQFIAIQKLEQDGAWFLAEKLRKILIQSIQNDKGHTCD